MSVPQCHSCHFENHSIPTSNQRPTSAQHQPPDNQEALSPSNRVIFVLVIFQDLYQHSTGGKSRTFLSMNHIRRASIAGAREDLATGQSQIFFAIPSAWTVSSP